MLVFQGDCVTQANLAYPALIRWICKPNSSKVILGVRFIFNQCDLGIMTHPFCLTSRYLTANRITLDATPTGSGHPWYCWLSTQAGRYFIHVSNFLLPPKWWHLRISKELATLSGHDRCIGIVFSICWCQWCSIVLVIDYADLVREVWCCEEAYHVQVCLCLPLRSHSD